MRRTLLACVLAGGCDFSLNGGVDDAGSGTPIVDAANPTEDVADSSPPCFGAGLVQVCTSVTPTGTIVLPDATIDTGVQASCTEVVMLGSIELCVIAGAMVQLPMLSTFRATGARPLVVIGAQAVLLDGELSVSSMRGQPPGAGVSTASCAAPAHGEDDGGGSGGGAGGSFVGRGGDGGDGDQNENGGAPGRGAGGIAIDGVAPTLLRAGCRGGNGGDGGGTIGFGGDGGGAVYVLAGSEIVVSGRIAANGAGGRGGEEQQSGGGGGGSGGFVGLEAPAIVLSGVITANGGGGGEGAGITGDGADGGNGSETTVPVLGGSGGDLEGGDGGAGAAGDTAATGGRRENGGGGGGGGGSGFVSLIGTLTGSGVVSPPAR